MQITWHGHSFFEIVSNKKKIIIDPFIEDNPVCNLSVEELGVVDLVLVSHGHHDHLGDALEICCNSAATFVANYEISLKAEEKGIKTEPMNIGGGIETLGFQIRMTEAQHSSGLNMGHAAGFVVDDGDVAVYHAGDTGLFYGMKLIGDLYNPDLALLPVGDRFTMGIREAARAAQFIEAAQVIPIHYNTFEAINQHPEELIPALSEQAQVILLDPGDTHLLRKNNA